MPKLRADILLVERGLAESRSQAQRLVMAGQVRANGQLVDKPSSLLQNEAALEIVRRPRYVSRGGQKLEAALQRFEIQLEGRVCADVGASTGGFTDCLLQHGAARVYAIDVGKGQLHWKLRQDPHVVVMEKSNARQIQKLPEQVDLVTIDASFISLKTLLSAIQNWLGKHGEVVALIKPQFEAGRKETARGKGVIRDKEIHYRVLTEVLSFFKEKGFALLGLMRSPILGPKGNVEFLLWANKSDESGAAVTEVIQAALSEN